MKTREFKIKIEMHFNCTKKEAYDKLKSWFESYGHTTVGHGFDLKEVAYLREDD
jgi:hypothetical protein